MSQIIFIHKKNDKELFNEYKYKISKMSIKTLCNNSSINKKYLLESIDLSDYLFVSLFRNEIRGFAIVYHESDNGKYLHISLICNSTQHNMKTRKNINVTRFGGKAIIQDIIKYGQKIKVKGIKLDAIKTVIPYYYKLGFHFIHSENKLDEEQKLIKQLQNSNTQEKKNTVLKNIVNKFYPGFFKEQNLYKMGKSDQEAFQEIMEDGIPMKLEFKKHSICKGKSIKNPNKCKKYKTCKVVTGNLRSYCRKKNNTTKKQTGGTKLKLGIADKDRIKAEWKGKDRQLYTYPRELYTPESQDDDEGISSLEQFTEKDSFEKLEKALVPDMTHIFVIVYGLVNKPKAVMYLGDQGHTHSQLSADKGDNWILAAGEIRRDKGDKKLKISNQSGHYEPDSQHVKDITIDFFAGLIDIDFYKPFKDESESSQSQSPQSPLDMGYTEPDDGVYRVHKEKLK